jgi:hypothetical protein
MASMSHPTLLGLYGFIPVGSANGDPPSIITGLAERGTLEDIIQTKMKKRRLPAGWDDSKQYIVLY